MKRIKNFFTNSFLVYLAMELAEEFLEDLIADGVSNIILKGASAFLVVTMMQLVKLPIKRIIKRITYREGLDKMNFIKKCMNWVFLNKKSICGTVGSIVTSIGVAYTTYGGYFDFLPAIMIGNFNFMSVIIGVVCFALMFIGIEAKGFESISTALKRRLEEKAQKEEKAIVKEAKAEIKAEQKLATQTLEQQEKARVKAELEQKAKIEKEKFDAEHKAKIERAKADLLAKQN